MGQIIRFLRQRTHARSTSRDLSSANASRVMPSTPFSEAKRASERQRSAGMPRTRQTLTVGTARQRAEATALVPPSESMTESDVIIDMTVVCTMQTCQEFAPEQTTFRDGYGAIRPMIDPPHVIAGRLEALRVELNIGTQDKFAEEIGLSKSTYSLIKNGKRNLSFETACLMKDKWGISIDWLFYGDVQQSAAQIMTKIGRGPAATDASAKQHRHPKRKSA